MNKDSDHTAGAGINPKAAIISLAVLGILFLVSGIVPINGLWGLNHLRYFSIFVWIIFAFLLGLILIPSVAVTLSGRLKSFTESFNRIPFFVRVIIISAIAGLIFYLFRVHVHSLGDGYLRIHQIQKGLTFLHTEPLDFSLHAWLFKFLNLFGTVSGEMTYIVYSIACGAVFVPAVILLRLPRPIDGATGAFIKTLVLSFGGLQLFFGYVESYSVFYPALLLFMLYAVRFLINGKGIIPVSIVFCIAMASHMAGIFYLPVFLYLLYHTYHSVKPESAIERAIPPALLGITLFSLFVVVFVTNENFSEQFGSTGDLLLPLFASGEYSVFSTEHLYNVFNQFLIITPAVLVVVAIYLFSKKSKIQIPGFTVFLGISAVISIFILLLVDPKLGYARDWDLFAAPAAAIGIIALVFVLTRLPFEKSDTRILFSIGMTGILVFSSWALTNASTPRQLKRAEELLFISERGQGYCTELLAHYYRYTAKDHEKVLELLNRISGKGKNARVYNAMARTEMDLKRYNDALISARNGLELDNSNGELYFLAGSALFKLDFADSSLPYLASAYYIDPRNFLYTQMLGQVYHSLGHNERALGAFKASNQANPKYASSYFDIAKLYYTMGQLDSAYLYVQQGLKLNPKYGAGYRLLEKIKQEASSKP